MAATATDKGLGTQRSGPNVAFVRPELNELEDKYQLVRDCLAGSIAVKKAGEKYLPKPNAADTSTENDNRYKAYIMRAVFYNVTKRTLSGLIGQIFLRDPVIEIPDTLEPLKEDISGSGIELDQMASMASAAALSYGRLGFLTDYPDTNVPATQADLKSGKIRPAVLIYNSWDIINWRTVVRNGKELLSLVVLKETFVVEDDGFEQEVKDQWRVLRLGPDFLYYVEIWREGETGFTPVQKFEPKDAKGNRLEEIPFTFVGVTNNDATPDDPPMFDLADINIAHYRNSADYEESSFITGQPTPVISGLTEAWVKDQLNGRVELGSRAAILLPKDATAELLQAEANIIPGDAMEKKERQMVALGAKLVEQRSVQRTLGEAELENTAEISVLASIAKNVEKAITFSLVWCARFVGADETSIKYQLNSEFDLTKLDPNERAEVIKEWQAGAITFSEMRENLRRGGVAKLDDKEAKAELAQDKKDDVGPKNLVDPNKLGPDGKPIASGDNKPPAQA